MENALRKFVEALQKPLLLCLERHAVLTWHQRSCSRLRMLLTQLLEAVLIIIFYLLVLGPARVDVSSSVAKSMGGWEPQMSMERKRLCFVSVPPKDEKGCKSIKGLCARKYGRKVGGYIQCCLMPNSLLRLVTTT